MSFGALVHREVLIDSVVMTDWQMLVETWPNGRHSFPKFTRDGPEAAWSEAIRDDGETRARASGAVHVRRSRRAVVHGRAESRSGGHGEEGRACPRAPQGGQAPDRVRRHREVQRRHSRDSAVRADEDRHDAARSGSRVRSCASARLELISDGSRSDITGVVDMSRWPEQTWNVQSVVQFPAHARDLLRARALAARWRGSFHRRLSPLQGWPRSLGHIHQSAGARQRSDVSGSPRIASMVAGKLQRDESVGGVRRRSHALRVRDCAARAARPAATRHVRYRVREAST